MIFKDKMIFKDEVAEPSFRLPPARIFLAVARVRRRTHGADAAASPHSIKEAYMEKPDGRCFC
jgi:hypothetical protein